MIDELEMYKEKYDKLLKEFVGLQGDYANLIAQNLELSKENAAMKIDILKFSLELKRVYDAISELDKSA